MGAYLRRPQPGVLGVQSLAFARALHGSASRFDVPSWPNQPVPQPPVGGQDDFVTALQEKQKGEQKKQSFWEEWSHSAGFQAALTTVVGLGLVFLAGVGYLEWYKAHVLHRVGIGRGAGADKTGGTCVPGGLCECYCEVGADR